MLEETGEAIDARARVVARARSFLGPGDIDTLQDPNQFFRIACPEFADKGLEHRKAWCGIFALACLKLEGIAPDIMWDPTGKGFVGHLKVTHEPLAGDVVIFGAPLWHHAIVDRVEGGLVHTIDGNVLAGLDAHGQPREGCGRRKRPLTPAVTFYSIHKLIADPGA